MLNFLHKISRIAFLQGVTAILVFLLAGCSRPASQMHFVSMEGDCWWGTDTVVLSVDSVRSSGGYCLGVSLRTSVERPYPYRQLVLEISQAWDSVYLQRTDTIEFQLAKADGDALGRGVSLNIYDYPIDTLLLESGMRGLVRVRHLMRRSPLPGISDVGIVLENLN